MALKSVVLKTLTILAFSASAIGDAAPIARASFCNRVMSHVFEFATMVIADPLVSATSRSRLLWDRAAESLVEKLDLSKKDFKDFSEAQRWAFKEFPSPTDSVLEILIPRYGTTLVTSKSIFKIQDLKDHFSRTLPPLQATIAIQTIDAFLNQRSIDQWMKNIKQEVLLEMWAQGLRSKRSFSSPVLREFYLDHVLARHAADKGFEIQENETPFGLYTATGHYFFKALRRRRFFVDWSGVTLRSGSNQARHTVRGHALQVAYGADHVVNLADLLQFIGTYGDTYSTWSFIFDDVTNTQTPFWGGNWVDRYGEFLGIRY